MLIAAEQPVLVVDLQANRVVYRGHEIPTRPPNNLQRQPLLALVVLASRAGRVVGMTELAEEMAQLGGMRKRLLTPEPKDLRYKILRPFKKALDGKRKWMDSSRTCPALALDWLSPCSSFASPGHRT